jgi:hypothetical protein
MNNLETNSENYYPVDDTLSGTVSYSCTILTPVRLKCRSKV